MTFEVAIKVGSLLGGIMLTWPALRAGRVLAGAAKMNRGAQAASDPTAARIFGRLHAAYLADQWRHSDQLWLYAGLLVTVLAGAADLIVTICAAK